MPRATYPLISLKFHLVCPLKVSPLEGVLPIFAYPDYRLISIAVVSISFLQTRQLDYQVGKIVIFSGRGEIVWRIKYMNKKKP